jgi:hypothetical protein
MQEVYCFILPFILKWLVAALIASVLVSLFSRLRRQGDHSSTTIYAQIRALFDERLQCVRHHVSSNNRTLLILVRLIGRGRVSGRVSKATRYAGNDYRIVHNDSVLALLTHVFCFLGILACMFQHHVASRLCCAVLDHTDFVRVMSQKLHADLRPPFKLVWLCVHRSVGQRVIKGIARPAVIPCTRSVQLPAVLYTPANIQVRSMVVTLNRASHSPCSSDSGPVCICAWTLFNVCQCCLVHMHEPPATMQSLFTCCCVQSTHAQAPLTIYSGAGSSKQA